MEGVIFDAWVRELTIDQLRDQAVLRGLSTEGTMPALRARILRYERDGRDTARSPVPPSPAFVELPPDLAREAEMPLAAVAEQTGRAESGVLSSGTSPGLSNALPTKGSPTERGLLEKEVSEPSWENLARGAINLGPPPARAATAARFDYFAPPPGAGAASSAEVWNTMRRWNLSFSGARGTDPEEFLRKIEIGRDIVPMQDADIFKCLPFFLSGVAAHWFRAKRPQWLSWGDFKRAFRARFGHPDYQFALEQEIRQRTQGEGEPVADYISCMLGLFDRLVPPWELTRQIEYTHRNLLPRIQVAVARDLCVDFDVLERIASRVEYSYEIARSYRAPPLPEHSLCPDLAYRPPARTARTPAMMSASEIFAPEVPRQESRGREGRQRVATQPIPPPNPVQPRPPGTSRENRAQVPRASGATAPGAPASPVAEAAEAPAAGDACWNCGRTGHRSRACRETQRVHCYRCGRQGYTARNCPSCVGNGRRRS